MQRILRLSLMLLGASSSASAQTTWHVDATAVPPGNGSVLQPYTDLQLALAQPTTVSGDTILVEPGTYVGAFDYLGKNVIVRSAQGAAVTVLDGNQQQVSVVSFVNGETNAAVLDGFTVTNGRGTIVGTYPEGGGIRCVGASPTLMRLNVTGNMAFSGAGVYLKNSASLVTGSTIASNRASVFIPHHALGAGIYSTDSAAIIEFCSFIGNSATGAVTNSNGGGFFGAATIRDCTFNSNGGANAGAGAYSIGATFTRCVFESNRAGAQFEIGYSFGGGVSSAVNGAFGLPPGGTIVVDCTFVNNKATNGGAIAGNASVPVQVQDSTFIGNATETVPGGSPSKGGAGFGASLLRCKLFENRSCEGGGLYGGSATQCEIRGNTVTRELGFEPGGAGAHSAALVDCDVFDNVAEDGPTSPSYVVARGGGSYAGTATRTRYARNRAPIGGGACGGVLEHCAFFANHATITGGTLAATSLVGQGSPLTAHNTICRVSSPATVGVEGTGAVTITYSDIEGGYSGVGNFDADPLFFAPQSGDFHLKPGSPCIDAGDPSSPLDPDGSRTDVGAYPFDASYSAAPTEWCAGKPNSLGCVPEITYSGLPTATGTDDFYVTATNFLGANFGLLAWSRTPNSIPFQGGTLCLSGPFFRAGLQFATGTPGVCDGNYTFHFSQSYRASFGIQTFETIYAQWFARDALNPDGTGWSLSNALEFTIIP